MKIAVVLAICRNANSFNLRTRFVGSHLENWRGLVKRIRYMLDNEILENHKRNLARKRFPVKTVKSGHQRVLIAGKGLI